MKVIYSSFVSIIKVLCPINVGPLTYFLNIYNNFSFKKSQDNNVMYKKIIQ